MIIQEIVGPKEAFDFSKYKIETLKIPYDYLNKDLFRVTSDWGKEYGVAIDHKRHPLHHHDVLYQDDTHLLVLEVLPQQMILIQPKTIDEMGILAHMLGNMHKPIAVKDGVIMLEIDPVVIHLLKKKHIPYETKKVVLDEPLNYADLGHHHD